MSRLNCTATERIITSSAGTASEDAHCPRTSTICGRLVAAALALGIGAGFAIADPPAKESYAQTTAVPAPEAGKPFTQHLEGTTVSFEMMPIPGGTAAGLITGETGDGPVNGPIALKPFWMGRCEVTWDEFDVYMYMLDQPGGMDRMLEAQEEMNAPKEHTEPDPDAEVVDPDAATHPSRPYLPPDRGYGHSDYAAISITQHTAEKYCQWLSKKTGRVYRLPTEAEWEYACRAGSTMPFCFGEDIIELDDFAWFADNSDFAPQMVGTKEPNDWGLHDMHGNVAEWCTNARGERVARGGSYINEGPGVAASARELQQDWWNVSDPQLPKSIWWLADCGFVGFRVVYVPDEQPNHSSGDEHPRDKTDQGR